LNEGSQAEPSKPGLRKLFGSGKSATETERTILYERRCQVSVALLFNIHNPVLVAHKYRLRRSRLLLANAAFAATFAQPNPQEHAGFVDYFVSFRRFQ
jgi:hypothetical protein